MTKLYDLARNRNVHFALRNIQTGGEAMTLEEVQRKVLGVTVECPDKGEEVGWKNGVHTEFGYRPFQDMPHRPCNGTGKVLRYPHLFEAFYTHCIHCYVEGHPWLNDEVGVPVPCHVCGGAGYVVRPVMETCWRLRRALEADGLWDLCKQTQVTLPTGSHPISATLAAL